MTSATSAERLPGLLGRLPGEVVDAAQLSFQLAAGKDPDLELR